MPTPGERRALIFLASVAALGVGARGWKEWRSTTGEAIAGDRAGLARQIAAVDSAIAAGGDRRRGRTVPGRPPRAERVAGAERANESRSRGPAAQQEPVTTDRDPRELYRLRRQHYDTAPPAPARPRSPSARGSRASGAPGRVPQPTRPPARVDLDTAPVELIEALPWVGRALAAEIVADRREHGPFGSIDGLDRIPGIGPAMAKRLQPYVTFSLPPRLGSTVESWPRARHRRRPGR